MTLTTASPDALPSAPPAFLSTPRRLQAHRYLVWNLAKADLKREYAGTWLGLAWSVLAALLTVGIYWWAFHFVIGIGQRPDYVLFLALGFLHWNFFHSAVHGASTVLMGRATLLDKVAFPRAALPGSRLLADLMRLLSGMLAVALVSPALGARASSYVWLYPIILAMFSAMTLGICLLAAVATAAVRDLEQLISVGLRLGFFASPVLYTFDRLPPTWQALLDVLPVAPFLHAMRGVLLDAAPPSGAEWGLMVGWSLLLLGGGYLLFLRTEPRLQEWL